MEIFGTAGIIISVIVTLVFLVILLWVLWVGACAAVVELYKRITADACNAHAREMGNRLASQAWWYSESPEAYAAMELLAVHLMANGFTDMDNDNTRQKWRASSVMYREEWRRRKAAEAKTNTPLN